MIELLNPMTGTWLRTGDSSRDAAGYKKWLILKLAIVKQNVMDYNTLNRIFRGKQMKVSDLHEYMKPGRHCHMVGIGGVSMSLLAEVLKSEGIHVTGSDMKNGETIRHLKSTGIEISVGHSPENIDGADFIIRTAAAHDDNPEIAAARDRGVPVFERAQAWGYIMQRYKNAICISGTHGKTTTTSMVTHILMEAEKDPTVMIGGTLPLLKSGYRIGKGDTIVLESDEYCNSFLSFYPTIAVILNVDEDHPDFFSGIEDIKKSFGRFAGLVPPNGCIVANCDDENTMSAIKGINRKVITFGMGKDADVRAKNTSIGKNTEFDIFYDNEKYAHVIIKVPGTHNVYNALAAAAASIALGIPREAVETGLGGFGGACRRLEHKGSYGGAEIYDDYAHHPGELRALYQAVSVMGFERTICIFQPHTYSRLKALFNDFAQVLRRFDVVLLADIYAARETDTMGISSGDLAEVIPNSKYLRSFDDILKELKSLARPGDIILTVGAGDIYEVGERLAESSR